MEGFYFAMEDRCSVVKCNCHGCKLEACSGGAISPPPEYLGILRVKSRRI